MLSGAAQQPAPRPRPPRAGTRSRSYLKSRDTNVMSPSSPTANIDEKAFPPQPQEPTVACHALGAAIQLDQDLDLDLPPGLTAALSSTDRWGRTSPSLLSPTGEADLRSSPDAYNGPKWGRGSRSPLSRTRSPTQPGSSENLRSSTPPLRTSSPLAPASSARRGSQADMLTETLNVVAHQQPQQTDADDELDRAWLGGLPREELEALLFQANAVIQERERDLGIAAAIGQALLQKNTSLRRKHEEVMDRFHATMEAGEADEDEETENAGHAREDADISDPPMYSPPNVNLAPEGTTSSTDDTPMPTPTHASDYFQYAAVPEHGSASTSQLPRSPSASSTSSSKYPESSAFAHMVPSTSGLISSTPQSPAGSTRYSASVVSPGSQSHYRQRHQAVISASMTQKQLSALSAQNETLLAQVAELQAEAEDAKKDGSKRLRKLNREIKGLQEELESVTERNVELELSKTPKKAWSRRGEPTGRESTSPTAISSQNQSPTEASHRPASLHLSTSSESLSSTLHALLKESPGSEATSGAEKSLVARLLAKVKELEQTNAALEQARRERDGRLGAALREGVKITDEYDAVLHLHESEMSFALSGGRDDDELTDDANSVASPSSLTSPHQVGGSSSRRALGNRWQVETRRTVRKALRRQRTAEEIWGPQGHFAHDGLPASTTDSTLSSMRSNSTTSSPFSSPRKPRRQRSALSMNRPRILITPSMEDLAAKRKEQAEGWVDRDEEADHPNVYDGLASPIQPPRSNSLDPSDAHTIVKRASDEALRAMRQRQAEEDEGRASTPVQSPGSPAWHSHATERALRRRASSAEHSVASSSSRRPHRVLMTSLGSELGSVLGDNDMDNDPTGDVTNTSLLRLYYENASPSRTRSADLTLTSAYGALSPTEASAPAHLSIRPQLKMQPSTESIAVSDIADLRYEKPGQDEPSLNGQPRLMLLKGSPHDARSVDSQLTNRVLAREGGWFNGSVATVGGGKGRASEEDHIVSSGALRDRLEPREEQYSLLERVIQDQPVIWADDEDYGVPLKESEARRLGLLAAATPVLGISRRSTLTRGLLDWAGLSSAQDKRKKSGATQARNASMILSSEQLEEEERREALLRAKYHRALQARGFESSREGDDLVEEYGADHIGDDSLEQEIEERAWAISSARYAKEQGQSNAGEVPRRRRTGGGRAGPQVYHPHSIHLSRRGSRTSLLDEDEEVLDESRVPDTNPAESLMPSSGSSTLIRRRPHRGTSTTAGRSTSESSRGRSPAISLDAGLATLNEVVAWASLVCVLIVAFFVSASRGELSPRRILGTGGGSAHGYGHGQGSAPVGGRGRGARRGVAPAPAPALGMGMGIGVGAPGAGRTGSRGS
ncbi:hypothetical protein BCV69DRAFT_203507 [Microstroma glucosiphilum]|uniref:Uncharacterized protein n=1 Tax=Pseudomicrostroma glucosiphilum TaxID=1684307 RepID=A0A316U4R6_9BASI|nr:hypothetical protein BCV69DRAFT_203507 [Pseudomicrostroma glucosiphilum]PWN20229.1 hypothetical protein BCV69DRAFT_203507 [Pseudomicrostroma glucosiphilum]